MAPFAMPLITTIAGAAITGMMNKGNKPAAMPVVKTPDVSDQDKTPGFMGTSDMNNSASQKQLSKPAQTVSNHLLGG